MALLYPLVIDSSATLPPVNSNTPFAPSIINNIQQVLIQIEAQLGVLPAGTFSTVRARLDYLQGIISSGGGGGGSSVTFAGDLTGTPFSQTVTGLYGHPIFNTSPVVGLPLIWDGA